MKTNIYSNEINNNEKENSNMHLVSKYAHILFEIKCETDINDSFCHEMEISLDDCETFYTEINLLTLEVFIEAYEKSYKKLSRKLKKHLPITLSDSINNIISNIPERTSNLKEFEYTITIEREELEQFILNFDNILTKLSI
ncbi:hypothetical protein [Bacillus sp. FSL R9-9410]|uniref:hypothetical protein n=1 Tax=Bacillus sp. FSL R9-9410 TaxID=2921590 RepID=UPI0031011CE3